ncbi:MAG: bacteriohemerythrin [Rhodocyclaceae bacterium]|nr:bacteriohemerythrin [Rhodocyclaceae bacterium]
MTSPTIEWSPALALGHAAIDRQHQKLFDLAADMVGDRDQVRAMRTLAALSEYVIVHFRDEEKLLAGIGYPNLAAHKRLHDTFRTRLAKLYGNAGGMTLDQIAEEVRLLINEWLTQHIMVSDREYAKYLQK